MKSVTVSPPLPMILDPEVRVSPQRPDDFAGLVATDRAAREEILHRAYAIWESDGHPENRQLSHWLEAEADVLRQVR